MWVSYLDRWDERQAAEDDGIRRVEPLAVGASLAFDSADGDGSFAALVERVVKYRSKSAEFYAAHRNDGLHFRYEGDVLSFRSDIVTETESNNIVQARVYEARKSRGAVIVLPHWNASLWGYHSFSKHLARSGFTVVELTLPYHGCRNRPDAIVSDYFLSANIGRTIRSVRQAIVDSRRVIDWLYQRNYEKVGLIGISLGSCLAGIVAAHDSRVRASALLLTAGDFAEVVWTGRATQHIGAAIATTTTLEQLQNVWSIISTERYVSQLARPEHRTLIISGSRDQVVRPYLTERFVGQLRSSGARCDWRVFGCGHYSLGMFPFNVMALLMLARFFRQEGFSA